MSSDARYDDVASVLHPEVTTRGAKWVRKKPSEARITENSYPAVKRRVASSLCSVSPNVNFVGEIASLGNPNILLCLRKISRQTEF